MNQDLPPEEVIKAYRSKVVQGSARAPSANHYAKDTLKVCGVCGVCGICGVVASVSPGQTSTGRASQGSHTLTLVDRNRTTLSSFFILFVFKGSPHDSLSFRATFTRATSHGAPQPKSASPKPKKREKKRKQGGFGGAHCTLG